MMCDRTRSLHDTTRQIGIRFGAVQSILTYILGMAKVSARWVPRMLTKDQKKSRLDNSKYLLSLYEDDSEKFMRRILTVDGSITLIHNRSLVLEEDLDEGLIIKLIESISSYGCKMYIKIQHGNRSNII